MQEIEQQVWSLLDNIIDPELGLSFPELGLIYQVAVDEDKIYVLYTLTTPACPILDTIEFQFKEILEPILTQKQQLILELTWEPFWTTDKMSEDAKFSLGF